MNSEEVYITANPTPNPDCLKFIIDRQMVDGEPVYYRSAEEASDSPLADKLFDIGGVKEIFAFQNFVTITKESDQVWQEFARSIGKVIRGHVQSGETVHFRPSAQNEQGEESDQVSVIRRVLDEIRPAVAMDGGNIVFAGYREGVVQVFMQGSCSGCPSSTITLKAGIERRLKEELPEVREVVAIS